MPQDESADTGDAGHISLGSNYLVAPPPEAGEMVALRRMDWDRICSRVKKLKTKIPGFSNAGWALAGIVVGSAYNLVAYFGSDETSRPAEWIVVVNVCVTGGGLLLAIGCFVASHYIGKAQSDSLQELDDDLSDIGRVFGIGAIPPEAG